jgi:hypothetical protein
VGSRAPGFYQFTQYKYRTILLEISPLLDRASSALSRLDAGWLVLMGVQAAV